MLIFDGVHTTSVVLAALLADALFGEPDLLWRRLPHPVVLCGRLIERLERRWRAPSADPKAQRRAGVQATLVVLGVALSAGFAVHLLCRLLPFGWLPEGLAASALIAQRSLFDHVRAVADGLERGLDAGRAAVSRIVGRDPAALDESGVARAAIESCAENFSDGVVAPVFWTLLFGLPGLAAYKAINTLDSMIGHRSPRYVHFGRFAARLDDAANLVPARLAGLLLVLAALLVRRDGRGGWRAMRRDASRHRSPNAGWPEAAMAGALGLRLAGPRVYAGERVEDVWMGDGRASADAGDVRASARLIALACLLVALALGAIRLTL